MREVENAGEGLGEVYRCDFPLVFVCLPPEPSAPPVDSFPFSLHVTRVLEPSRPRSFLSFNFVDTLWHFVNYSLSCTYSTSVVCRKVKFTLYDSPNGPHIPQLPR